MWTAGTIPKNIKRAQSMSRTLRSNNSEFRKEQIGLNTSVERPAFSNPPLNEAVVMARAPSRQIPTCSQLLPEVDPLQHRVQCRTQRLTPRRETVFHLGRYFRIGLAHDDAISLHLTKLLAEHLLRDFGNCTLQLREAEDFATEQMEEYDKLPTSFEK